MVNKRSRYNSAHQPGYSLLELTIACALIAIVVTMGLASSSFLHRALVRSEMEKLYYTCMYLQRKAISTNEKQTLSLDPTNNSYHYGNTEEKLCRHVQFGTLDGTKGPPATPTKLITKPITFAGNAITFHPDGILRPGTVYFKDSNNSCQYALSIAVAQVSFIRMYHYTTTWHSLV